MVSNTWYNEEKNRWEMDAMVVSYAVSKKLVDYARIRHDWGAMYIALKGEDKEFYVDLKVVYYLLYISLKLHSFVSKIILIAGV